MKRLIQSIKVTAFFFTIAVSVAACNSGTTSTEESTTGNSDSAGTMSSGMDTANTGSMNMAATSDTLKQHAAAVLTGVFTDTTVTGNVQFDAANGKVKMKLEMSIPAKANHKVAVHIHENGDCADMGKAAGGHWNPTGANHGKWGSASFHSGDIGNVSLDSKGNGSLEMETDLWSLGGDAKTNILNKSIIVHGGVDDFTSQPSGNAGTRIACGVIH